MLAKLNNGTVVEIYKALDGFKLSDCFHPDILAAAQDIPPYVTQGSTLADGVWTDAEGNVLVDPYAEEPVEEPAEEPVEAPVEEPVEAPVEELVEEPTE